MTTSNKYIFLIEACIKSKGHTNHRIDITEICQKIGIGNKNNDNQIEIIDSLIMEGYIRRIQGSNEATITREGFYYAIKLSGWSAENFGMVSYEEANRLSIDTLKFLSKETINNVNREFSIDKIKIGNYGGAVVDQVLDILKEKGFIEPLDDQKIFKITPKGIHEVLKSILFDCLSVWV